MEKKIRNFNYTLRKIWIFYRFLLLNKVCVTYV